MARGTWITQGEVLSTQAGFATPLMEYGVFGSPTAGVLWWWRRAGPARGASCRSESPTVTSWWAGDGVSWGEKQWGWVSLLHVLCIPILP